MKITNNKKIIVILTIFFFILFLDITVNTIFRNTTIGIYYKISTMILSVIILYVIIFFIYKICLRNIEENKNKVIKMILAIISAIIILLTQIIIANFTYAPCGWDCGFVVNNAFEIINGLDIDKYYFSHYSNNMGILLLEKNLYLFVNIFHKIKDIQECFKINVIFNILMLDITAIITFLTCNKLIGKKYISLIYIFPLILFTPYLIIPYTDTISMLFPILSYYLFLIAKDENNNIKKILLILLNGIITSIGVIIKPTCIIIVISIIIGQILYTRFSKKKVFGLLKCFIIFTIGFSLIYVLFNNIRTKYINKEEYNNNSMPFTHFIMMGMQIQTNDGEPKGKGNKLYGVFCGEDINGTNSKNNKKEKKAYNISIIKERLKNFGVIGYLRFLHEKLIWITCDGTFFYGCEGNFFKDMPYNKTNMGEKIQKFFDIKTNEFKILANSLQTIWIILQISLIFAISRKRIYEEIEILKIAILGIILFILLFEGRSRYLINYIPIFIIVGTYGLEKNLNMLYDFEKKIKIIFMEEIWKRRKLQ